MIPDYVRFFAALGHLLFRLRECGSLEYNSLLATPEGIIHAAMILEEFGLIESTDLGPGTYNYRFTLTDKGRSLMAY